jgi:hypothetical protein
MRNELILLSIPSDLHDLRANLVARDDEEIHVRGIPLLFMDPLVISGHQTSP